MRRRTTLRLVALILVIIGCRSGSAPAAAPSVTVGPADVARVRSPMAVPLDAATAAEIPAGVVTLTSSAGAALVGQVDRSRGATVLRWIEPNLEAGQSRSYALRPAEKPAETFRFIDGDGFRDLHHGNAKIWRDMIKWDPAEREKTFKPFQHIYAFDRMVAGGDETFITKGPGGKFPHHRGIFFGFKASADGSSLGDFWHGRDVTQRHVKYLTDAAFAGPVAARSAAVTDWVGKDGTSAVVRDTRTETTWRIGPDRYVLDYEIAVESLFGEPVRLFADAHHGGFHFRAAQEVAETPGKDGKPGSAVYARPAKARHTGNDIWADCPWIECTFNVGGRPYSVTLLDHPLNPRPTTFSTRPYGRFGAYFEAEVQPGSPLSLKYRLIVRSGGPSDSAELDDAAGAFATTR